MFGIFPTVWLGTRRLVPLDVREELLRATDENVQIALRDTLVMWLAAAGQTVDGYVDDLRDRAQSSDKVARWRRRLSRCGHACAVAVAADFNIV